MLIFDLMTRLFSFNTLRLFFDMFWHRHFCRNVFDENRINISLAVMHVEPVQTSSQTHWMFECWPSMIKLYNRSALKSCSQSLLKNLVLKATRVWIIWWGPRTTLFCSYNSWSGVRSRVSLWSPCKKPKQVMSCGYMKGILQTLTSGIPVKALSDD